VTTVLLTEYHALTAAAAERLVSKLSIMDRQRRVDDGLAIRYDGMRWVWGRMLVVLVIDLHRRSLKLILVLC